jgi:hypothetical protein
MMDRNGGRMAGWTVVTLLYLGAAGIAMRGFFSEPLDNWNYAGVLCISLAVGGTVALIIVRGQRRLRRLIVHTAETLADPDRDPPSSADDIGED